MPKIHSTIEILSEGCTMPHKKRKPKYKESVENGQIEPHKHHYKSEAHSDKNRFFHNVKNANAGVNQTVNVEVKVEGEGCFEGLLKALGGCCGKKP